MVFSIRSRSRVELTSLEISRKVLEKVHLGFHFLEHSTIGNSHPDMFGKRHGKGHFRFGKLSGVLR